MQRKSLAILGAAAILGTVTAAEAAVLGISIGIRETVAAGGPNGPIGSNGGSLGGIEWVNKDGQSLVLDGTFQTFTFNFQTDALTAFAGTSANGLYDGVRGVLEHIRILNTDGVTGPISLYIDNIRNIAPTGAPTTVSDFEGFADGVEVTFQEPRFSGSTSAFLALTPNASLTSSAFASQGTTSNNVNFQFINNTPTNWLRLSTFNTPNLPNPLIDFGQGWQLTFDMRGEVVPEPATIGMLGLAGLALFRRQRS